MINSNSLIILSLLIASTPRLTSPRARSPSPNPKPMYFNTEGNYARGPSPSRRYTPPPLRVGSPSVGTPGGKSKDFSQLDATLFGGAYTAASRKLTSLKGIGIVEELEKLHLQNNFLTDFSYLRIQPRLNHINVENNRIRSFKGLMYQPRLHSIVLAGNPIAQNPMHRVMALLAVGASLKKVDDANITLSESVLARQFGVKAAQCIRMGYVFSDSVPKTDEEYESILQRLRLSDVEEDRQQQAAARAGRGLSHITDPACEMHSPTSTSARRDASPRSYMAPSRHASAATAEATTPRGVSASPTPWMAPSPTGSLHHHSKALAVHASPQGTSAKNSPQKKKNASLTLELVNRRNHELTEENRKLQLRMLHYQRALREAERKRESEIHDYQTCIRVESSAMIERINNLMLELEGQLGSQSLDMLRIRNAHLEWLKQLRLRQSIYPSVGTLMHEISMEGSAMTEEIANVLAQQAHDLTSGAPVEVEVVMEGLEGEKEVDSPLSIIQQETIHQADVQREMQALMQKYEAIEEQLESIQTDVNTQTEAEGEVGKGKEEENVAVVETESEEVIEAEDNDNVVLTTNEEKALPMDAEEGGEEEITSSEKVENENAVINDVMEQVSTQEGEEVEKEMLESEMAATVTEDTKDTPEPAAPAEEQEQESAPVTANDAIVLVEEVETTPESSPSPSPETSQHLVEAVQRLSSLSKKELKELEKQEKLKFKMALKLAKDQEKKRQVEAKKLKKEQSQKQ